MNAASASALSPSDDSGTPQKRKNDGHHPQQRAKRTRYISIACNECKRRKIKCNGETPCQRCGNMNLECIYAPNCCNGFKDSEEYKQMEAHIAHLQDQVNVLFDNLNAMRHHIDSTVGPLEASPYAQSSYPPPQPISHTPASQASPGHKRSHSLPRHASFHGPTSAAYNIGVAKSSLQTMGITASDDPLEEAMSPREGSPNGSPLMSNQLLPKSPGVHSTKDQIWAITRAEAVRLCHAWESEIGVMYPVIEIDQVIRYANRLYDFIEAGTRSGFVQLMLPGADSIHDEETIILKLILATALIMEGSGKSDMGQRIFEQASPAVNEQMIKTPNIISIQILCLSAMYQFNRDSESQAWRIVGICARLCMELGLHRHETYDTLFSTAEERASAVKLFWAIYVLDRRWSFGTGMPFALQDADIDPELPMPDDNIPYLTAMISYSRIGSKVWNGIASTNSNGQPSINSEELEYLDYQVINWIQGLPASLQFTHPASGQQEPESTTRSSYRLRLLLYLRANQMRILIYRPVLQTPNCIMDHLRHANTVVDLAKDTIRILTHMNRTTDFYRTHQILFNYFLISALAVLFLAVSHAPAQFSESCRDEFYQALELVRGLSATSYVSKRLWKTIKSLKEVGPKLGLNLSSQQAPSAVDAHSSAAVAMAGLAGHQVDEMIFANGGSTGYLQQQQQQQQQAEGVGASQGRVNETPNGMANDLTSLFEAAGHFSNLMPNGFGMGPAPQQAGGELGVSGGQGADGQQVLFGHEEELARILKDLF